jgi:hypothetical protein
VRYIYKYNQLHSLITLAEIMVGFETNRGAQSSPGLMNQASLECKGGGGALSN